MMRNICGTILLAISLISVGTAPVSSTPPEADPPVDVAPEVEETRLQKWPRATWCEEAACWLVVWREGDVADRKTDIWCARIDADGKALDSAGIRITSAEGVKDRPVVASDGKGFLVAWQDLRNGKDWDLYAARVSAKGTVLDPDGFLVGGGAHSQCAPSAIFTGGNYLVAWQTFLSGDIVTSGTRRLKMTFGSYEVRGSRISAAGKVLDVGGKVLAPAPAFQACLAPDGNGNAWLAYIGLQGKKIPTHDAHFPYLVAIDAATCAPRGKPGASDETRKVLTSGVKNAREFGGGGATMSMVCMKDKGGIVATRGYHGGTTLFSFDKDSNTRKMLKIHNGECRYVMTVFSLAADGDRLLMVRDWTHNKTKTSRPNMGIWGHMLSLAGEIREGGEDGFPLAVEKGKDRLQSFVCAGPSGGAFLLVCAEPRAPEDTKVVARLLK